MPELEIPGSTAFTIYAEGGKGHPYPCVLNQDGKPAEIDELYDKKIIGVEYHRDTIILHLEKQAGQTAEAPAALDTRRGP